MGDKRKIYFVNRFYYPDTSATAQILTDLCNNFSARGYQVEIITSRLLYEGVDTLLPSNENLSGVNVTRVWTSQFGRVFLPGRLIDYLTFYITSFFTMLFKVRKNDILVAKTDPPLISVPAMIVSFLRRAHLVNWLQDMFPEVASRLNVKGLKSGPIYEFIRSLRNLSLKRAKLNVVIGEVMANLLEREINQPAKIRIIHNWVIDKEIKSIAHEENSLKKEWGLDNVFVVGYSGNLGRAHDYKTMLCVMEKLQNNSNIKFLFIGGGVGMVALKEEAYAKNLTNVIFKPYQDKNVLSESLSASDVHLITLEEQLEGLIVPSKVYGVLAVSRPIIFIGSKNGEFSKLQKIECIGEIVPVGDDVQLLNSITKLANNGTLYSEYKNACQKLYRDNFMYGVSIDRWIKLIDDIHNGVMDS